MMDILPTLTTHRLTLNQIGTADIPQIVSLANNLKVTQTTRTMPYPYFEKDAMAWIAMCDQGLSDGNKYIFAIRDKHTHDFMGGIGLTLDIANNRAELGYWIGEPFWNNGFTTEAVRPILKFGFETLQLNKIIAVYVDTNGASGKIMIKNGMVKEGELKQHDFKNGMYINLVLYRMLKTEYEKLTFK